MKIFNTDDIGVRADIANGQEFVRQQLVEFIGHVCVIALTNPPIAFSKIRHTQWPLSEEIEKSILDFLNDHSDKVEWDFNYEGSLICRQPKPLHGSVE